MEPDWQESNQGQSSDEGTGITDSNLTYFTYASPLLLSFKIFINAQNISNKLFADEVQDMLISYGYLCLLKSSVSTWYCSDTLMSTETIILLSP